MDVLVIGGRGFVGAAVTEQLRENGHAVTTMDPHIGGSNHISLDLRSDALPDVVEGFDTVVNMVGLSPMRQQPTDRYESIHVDGVENVVRACHGTGVNRLVHMSALGADPAADTAFLRTKGEGEDIVLAADLETTVFKPSTIFDHGNELVEHAKRFAPTRMFPRISTRIEPVYRGDVADLFVQAVEDGIEADVVPVGGPDVMTIYDFAKHIYRAKGYRCIPVPLEPVMKLMLPALEVVPFVPFGVDQARLLDIDNVTAENIGATCLDEITAYTDWVDDAF